MHYAIVWPAKSCYHSKISPIQHFKITLWYKIIRPLHISRLRDRFDFLLLLIGVNDRHNIMKATKKFQHRKLVENWCNIFHKLMKKDRTTWYLLVLQNQNFYDHITESTHCCKTSQHSTCRLAVYIYWKSDGIEFWVVWCFGIRVNSWLLDHQNIR